LNVELCHLKHIETLCEGKIVVENVPAEQFVFVEISR
jgi:hypothetical protein